MHRSKILLSPVVLGSGIGVLIALGLLLFHNVLQLNQGKRQDISTYPVGLAIGATVGAVVGVATKYLLRSTPDGGSSKLYDAGVNSIADQFIQDGFVRATERVEGTREEMGLHPVNWQEKTIAVSPELAQLISQLPLPGAEDAEEYNQQPESTEIYSDIPDFWGDTRNSVGNAQSPQPSVPEDFASVPTSVPTPAANPAANPEEDLVLPLDLLGMGFHSGGNHNSDEPWGDRQ